MSTKCNIYNAVVVYLGDNIVDTFCFTFEIVDNGGHELFEFLC